MSLKRSQGPDGLEARMKLHMRQANHQVRKREERTAEETKEITINEELGVSNNHHGHEDNDHKEPHKRVLYTKEDLQQKTTFHIFAERTDNHLTYNGRRH